MPQSTNLDGGRELSKIKVERPLDGSLWQRTIDAINRLAKNAGVGAVGELPAPPPIDGIEVKGVFSGNTLTVPGEILHWTIQHNSPIQRGIQYITEIDTDPSFSNPHSFDHGASRSGFAMLPTLDDNGNPATYYMRSIAQYHGSAPAPPTVHGGILGPIGIQMSGTTQMSLLPSQTAGTAKPGQGGQGLGKVSSRSQVSPTKRVLTQVVK